MRAGLLGSRQQAYAAAGLYLVLSLVMTWPLGRVLDSEIAWDMGDPLFNSWVLKWTGGQLLEFLSGNMSALAKYWHGNIFYPEPLTIAYSEHLFPQMIQALPILAATDNVVLAYNLLFLSTMVLSGLGMFLLVRELTGNAVAAFVAGVAFAFAPYRVTQYSHLQVLSSQWMPFVLYGFRRYFETGRRRALAGGTAALILQNLSCGYYLLFFAPFAGLYVLFEMAVRGRLADWRAWRPLIASAAVVVVLTAPFLGPYLDLRSGGGDLGVRSRGEIAMFSADTHALITPAPALKVWAGHLEGFPRPEGEGFIGVTIGLSALIAIVAASVRRVRRMLKAEFSPLPPWRQILNGALGVMLVVHVLVLVALMATGRLWLPSGGGWIAVQDARNLPAQTLGLLVALTISSPGVRRFLSFGSHSLIGFFSVAAALAFLLALGPDIAANGHVVAPGPYGWLVDYVPGFDGVRVPARYLMLVALFLAGLAGFGIAALTSGRRWALLVIGALATTGILAESWTGPFQTNVRLAAERYRPTPRQLHTGRDIPPIYAALRRSAAAVALLEFPFGVQAWDLHAVFYAGYHRRPLVNGFSGFFPERQRDFVQIMTLWREDPEAVWRALLATRATHVLVHEGAYPGDEGTRMSDWLRDHGAIEVLVVGTDRLFSLYRSGVTGWR